MPNTATRLGYGHCRTLDFRPATVDLHGYAGDTMKLRVMTDDATILSGGAWTAQVKTSRDAPGPDAEFTVDVLTDTTVLLTLSAEDTALLGGGYVGYWDVQVQVDEQVRTLVQGGFKLDADVTRPVG